MQFVRLRLAGFKSFVDPTELPIEPGMTGVVGPNGCGKSNLVEALRWVMGETSAKQMRGDGMDDVIFAGTSGRPSRNIAEVALAVDNRQRRAPAQLNDADELTILRRIERQSGSTYRVNGREVRARDVQLLFADAASGAHSPSMVGQGRVGAIVNARPSERRAILEEAAGITGLYSRRHEAELRLRGAETNLERLADVTGALEQQLQGLRRQARQAERYRKVAEQIRRLEAILVFLRHRAAEAALAEARTRLDAAERVVARHAGEVARLNAEHERSADRLPLERQAEAEAAARLQRLVAERGSRAEEARRIGDTLRQLDDRLRQVVADRGREASAAADAALALERLAAEHAGLAAAGADAPARDAAAAAAADALAVRVAEAEAGLDRAQAEVARLSAERGGLEARLKEAEQRLARLTARRDEAATEQRRIDERLAADPGLQAAEDRLAAAGAEHEAAAAALDAAEAARRTADAAAQERRAEQQRLEAEAKRLGAERAALEKALAPRQSGGFPPVLDAVAAAPGYEAALAAALGDDLDVPADPRAPAHWAELAPDPAAPALPDGVAVLADRVEAPPALARRLAQVGVVDGADGVCLRGRLATGQRLVSRDGTLWRWDGFTRAAGAGTAAALRLSQRNRLKEVAGQQAEAEAGLGAARTAAEAARQALDAGQRDLAAARARHKAAERGLAEARQQRGQAERRLADLTGRRTTLAATLEGLAGDLAEAAEARAATAAALSAAADPAAERQRADGLRTEVAGLRRAAADARAALAELRREAQVRTERLARIERELADWRRRADDAGRQIAALDERQRAAEAEQAELAGRPQQLDTEIDRLDEAVATAESARRRAADTLAEAEQTSARVGAARREAEQALATAREERVRVEAAVGQARERRDELVRHAVEELECRPERALAAADVPEDEPLPELEEAEARLHRLRRERESLGAVNLRAEVEAEELDRQLAGLGHERADLEAAIQRLRQAIASLNREGRDRLLAAFAEVDGHFRTLFAALFGGGTAHLKLTESDDPLQAGLEIMASPPGKRLATMSLLSGGEKALTAMCLLFAVFMTNPAPLCVLDEVDAPLDDANVERFCNLVERIARETGTRFLVVTHHPYTMARMDRLFGVTMAEAGVSTLVSVDLARAERLRATA